MLVKFLIAALSMAAMMSSSAVMAQSNGACSTDLKDDFSCQIVESDMTDGSTLSVSFTYNSAGQICNIISGSVSNPCPTGTDPALCFVDLLTLGAPTGTARVRVASINGNTEATNLELSFTAANDISGATGSGSIGQTMSGNAIITTDNTYGGAATLVYNNAGTFSVNHQVINTVANDDHCAQITSDPHFSGFLGQQFFVGGQPGAVLNLLSSNSMQINTRLVQLAEGQSMTESQQKMARLGSLNALPYTRFFDHEGTYMGELGLVLSSGHKLYAQAGEYKNGFNSVRLDDSEFEMSSTPIVLGSGDEQVTLTHPNAHQLVIESKYVHLTVTNSDKFFNIEDAHLEQKRTAFGGALGQTANYKFQAHNGDAQWQEKIEKDALVESGDLFELSPIKAQVA